MILKPEEFIESHKNKSFKSLLSVRDELFAEIRAFENQNYNSGVGMSDPVPELVYLQDLMYLGKLCELISEKYNQEYVWGKEKEQTFLDVIRTFLESKGLGYNTALMAEIKKRKAGKQYTIQDHVRGMVYSMLTNQTKWHRVEPHLPEIDKLFYGYDPNKLLVTDPEYFCKGLFRIKCGNMNTKAQMEALSNNIRVLKNIEIKYGSIDAFITSEPPERIVKMLSKGTSPYKLKMLGEALVWEYLRNVGIDGAKPDTHLRRFFSSNRMGTGKHSPATIDEVNEQVTRLSDKTGMSKVEIDNLVWSFCAYGFGEICTAKPHCEICPIREWCKEH